MNPVYSTLRYAGSRSSSSANWKQTREVEELVCSDTATSATEDRVPFAELDIIIATQKALSMENSASSAGWLKRKWSTRSRKHHRHSLRDVEHNLWELLEYDGAIEEIRKNQYPMLTGITYLDHAGTTQPSKLLIDTFSSQVTTKLVANPHSALTSCPSIAEEIVTSTRQSVLKMFNASPEHFEVVFVANATAAIKLVADAFQGYSEGFDYYYHRDCHTSLVGVRELARNSHCLTSDEETEQWLDSGDKRWDFRPMLFAYPAQSNMNGRRLPLSWPSRVRPYTSLNNRYTLLDVAAYVSTTPLDLSDHTTAPDFMSLSFYKIFGFPDLGALIVRKSAAHVFSKRKYFGGGTTDIVTVDDSPSIERKSGDLCAAVEDGTGATRSILALQCAIKVHEDMYGGLAQVSKHTGWLAKQLYDRLNALKHSNGRAVCHIYKDPRSTYGDPETQGATVTFNIRDGDGKWLESSIVGNLAMEAKIHLRSGAMCNPGGMSQALNLTADDIRNGYAAGHICGQGGDGSRATGMVRASFGACSTLSDVLVLAQWIEKSFIVEKESPRPWKLSSHSMVGIWPGAWGVLTLPTESSGRRA